MPTGTISYWNEAKGFGFARKEDGGEAFVHVSELVDEIHRGAGSGAAHHIRRAAF